jgi:hypothetical protein
LRRLHAEADVLTTFLNRTKGRFPGTTTGPCFTDGKQHSQTRSGSVPLDIADFTMSADYIHSAELVNMRYSRQTVLSAIILGSP